MKIKIIKSQKKDYKKISDIYLKEFSKYPYNEPWNIKKSLEKIKLLEKYCEIYSIYFSEKIIGFFAINPNKFFPGKTLELEEICIDSYFQKKGMGSFCIGWIEKNFKSKGYEEFILISPRNKKQEAFYEKNNFKKNKKQILFEKPINKKLK